MSSEESEELHPKRKKMPLTELDDTLSDSSDEASSPGLASTSRKKRKVIRHGIDTDSDSSDDFEIVYKRRKVARVPSDSDVNTDSSSPLIVQRRYNNRAISTSDDESDNGNTSSWESDSSTEQKPPETAKASTSELSKDASADSDSSDENTDKCPICFKSFKLQQVGVPENCDHSFCLECIQEWSRTVNTCPIDRKEYNSIMVKKYLKGEVLQNIKIEKPTQNTDDDIIIEDPTHCEICGSTGDEDILLLCDGCDLAYHLYCLTPPLSEVPQGAWYCDTCNPGWNRILVDELDDERIRQRLLFGRLTDEDLRRFSSRLRPRTRHSERVRRRVESIREHRREPPANLIEDSQPSTSSAPGPSSSTSSRRVSSTTTTTTTSRRKRAKKRKSRAKKKRYRTVWVVNAQGEAVAEQRVVQKKRKRKGRKRKPVAKKATVKTRLAAQIGICPRQNASQLVPDVRVPHNAAGGRGGSSAIVQRIRSEAGLVPLDLFGRRDQLDDFQMSDDDDNDHQPRGVHTLLSGRTSGYSDAMSVRRMARRKAALVEDVAVVSSSTDILGSIMESQEKFLSKDSILTVVDSSGTIKIESKKKPSINNNNNSPSKPDFNAYSIRQTPWNSGKNDSNNYQPNRNNWSNNRHNNWQNYQGGYRDRSRSFGQGTGRGGGGGGGGGGANFNRNYAQEDRDQYYNDVPQDYTQRTLCEAQQLQEEDDEDSNKEKPERSDTPASDADVDIYDDIENSTLPSGRGMIEDEPAVSSSPPMTACQTAANATDEDNDSESGMVIDTAANEEPVSSSTVPEEVQYSPGEPTDSPPVAPTEDPPADAEPPPPPAVVDSSSAVVPSTGQEDDEVSNDGCPNFSIYSRQSKSVALTTDISLASAQKEAESTPEDVTDPQQVTVEKTGSDPRLQKDADWNAGGLYSDSEDENVVKKTNAFALSDIKDMTEDILSEEERSYTPVMDERAAPPPSPPPPAAPPKEGIEGLDTEMISDDDRGDFDESQDLKTVVSDGDALEINAKESELEFTRPEDFEDGEIVDKGKAKDRPTVPESKQGKDNNNKKPQEDKKKAKKDKEKTTAATTAATTTSASNGGGANKENNLSFKKLTKSSKDRNYRDKDRNKDRSRSGSPTRSSALEKERKRKEKRKELERYNVRAIIAEKPRAPPKDQFGRDLRRSASPRSRSRSYTPPLSPTTRVRRASPSPIRAPTPVARRKSRSKTPPKRRRSRSRTKSKEKTSSRKRGRPSRSKSPKADRSRTKKRKQRSTSKSNKRKKSKDASRKRPRSRKRSRSVASRRSARREWTPSLSRSLSPIPPPLHRISPSWTPPRTAPESIGALRNQNLTVILSNDTVKKKKDKRNKERKRKGESATAVKRRRRERERTPPPSKEVFASGDNILVSVSFNNESEIRDVSTRENRKRKSKEAAAAAAAAAAANEAAPSQKKNKEKKTSKTTKKDLSGIKPVAIIDLERSPFQEVSSPKDVIVLSDSDNNDNAAGVPTTTSTTTCDASRQAASPEATTLNYSTGGPKTPPEPSVKFALMPKPPQVRAINNPLHDPLETVEEEIRAADDDADDDSGAAAAAAAYKGPNTPPEEPPTSPPSSPDAYDPFEPTKSRSPTPEPSGGGQEKTNEKSGQETLTIDGEEAASPPPATAALPPMPDIQPADSQSSVPEVIIESNSPAEGDRVLPAVLTATVIGQPATTKPVAQTTPFSSVVQTSVAPLVSSLNSNSSSSNNNNNNNNNSTVPRINIRSTAIIPATIPQNVVLPSPAKVSPTKAAVKSLTPIKPIQLKPSSGGNKKTKQTNGGGGGADDSSLNMDFDSPYSPGSSDYEDLFEPPTEPPKSKTSSKTKHSGGKQGGGGQASVFDSLFESPTFNKKTAKLKTKKTQPVPAKGKQATSKLNEDRLKILEELPNSAVEMQVKEKFLKKLNRQERVVEEVKLVLKPYYNKKKITKDEYKDIMRRAVPKICHNKSGEINPNKIRHLIEAYVKKIKHSKKVTSSSSLPQKVV